MATNGPVDPRVESGSARPAGRVRPRVTRPDASPVARETTPDLDPTPAAWTLAPDRDEPTGPLEMIPAAARSVPPPPPAVRRPVSIIPEPTTPVYEPIIDPVPEPLWGEALAAPGRTAMPVVVPSLRDDTGPGLIPTAPEVEPVPSRRKERPKMVRLPRRPRVRKVSRVVRSIDAWSVFKISAIFYLAMYVVFLVAGVLLWNVAYSTGTIDNLSSFFESFGWKNFEFKGGEIYHNAWILGLFVAAGLTGLNVVLATLYNLITDLVGGVRLTVLEEEVLVRPAGEGRGEPAPAGSTTPVRPNRRERRFSKAARPG